MYIERYIYIYYIYFYISGTIKTLVDQLCSEGSFVLDTKHRVETRHPKKTMPIIVQVSISDLLYKMAYIRARGRIRHSNTLAARICSKVGPDDRPFLFLFLSSSVPSLFVFLFLVLSFSFRVFPFTMLFLYLNIHKCKTMYRDSPHKNDTRFF